MATSPDPSPIPHDTQHTAAYRALRAASKSWFDKIMEHPAAQRFDLPEAGRKLATLTQDRTFTFDNETEMAVLMDYYLLDYRPEQRSLAETATFAPGELNDLEAAFHQGCLTSRTSLFEVSSVHAHEPKILLRDLLKPDSPDIWLTDLGLSASVRRIGTGTLMFTRAVPARGLHISGGFSFVFDPRHRSALVDGYRRAMMPVAQKHHAHRRTGFFLALNRKLGLGQGYADVEPAREPEAR